MKNSKLVVSLVALLGLSACAQMESLKAKYDSTANKFSTVRSVVSDVESVGRRVRSAKRVVTN